MIYLFLNPFPNDLGHLVSVNVDHDVFNLNFSEGGELAAGYPGKHNLQI
jgi:hypothetical protein